LYVFDSFSGLPAPTAFDKIHHAFSGRVKHYTEGDYRGTLDEVRRNVARWGVLEACEFVPGDFSETLPTFAGEPALVFMDVDLIESARTCLRLLWPILREGGRFFTHEAGVETFLDGVLDPIWWHSALKQCPPVLYGAGYRFGPHAANLAYLKKDRGKDALTHEPNPQP
jgi:O-methyltransferase